MMANAKFLVYLALLLVVAVSAHKDDSDSSLRRRLDEEFAEVEELPTGFFANVWNVVVNGEEWNWKPFGEADGSEEEDNSIDALGALVFEITIDGKPSKFAATAKLLSSTIWLFNRSTRRRNSPCSK